MSWPIGMTELLSRLPVATLGRDPQCYSALHLYVIRVATADGAPGRGQFVEFLRAQGVGVNVHYIPIHTQPYYAQMGFKLGDFPQAEAYYAQAVSVPMFPTMNEAQQDQVVAAVEAALH